MCSTPYNAQDSLHTEKGPAPQVSRAAVEKSFSRGISYPCFIVLFTFFKKSLLNLSQYCFYCLSSGFLAPRHMESSLPCGIGSDG